MKRVFGLVLASLFNHWPRGPTPAARRSALRAALRLKAPLGSLRSRRVQSELCSTLLALVLALPACREKAPVVPEGPEGPVAWSVTASADKNQVQVGEELTLTLVLRHPADGRYIAPPDTALTPFDVIGKSEEIVSPAETRLHYRLAAFRLPGKVEIPGLQIQYQKDGAIETLKTDAIPVEVVTSLTPDVTDIHDIKDPLDLTVPRDFRLLWWLLLALAAALLAYFIYRKLRKEPEGVKAPAVAPPLPPPDVEAEAALRRLAEKDFIRKGQFSAFYTELSEVMKRYAGRRFEVPYLERTTSEVLSDLKPRKLAPGVVSELRAILEASDLVKFAKLMPQASQAEAAFALGLSWVEKTRPAPVPTSEPARAIA